VFPVTVGQKFIRLYFYPASYPNFDGSKALFSVKAGSFTLLSNFNTSLTADADDDPEDTIFREYCVNIEKGQRLNIAFTLSAANAYALVNGIEILSMLSNLYYTPSDNEGLFFIGQQTQKKKRGRDQFYCTFHKLPQDVLVDLDIPKSISISKTMKEQKRKH
jgi:hypothetical protein